MRTPEIADILSRVISHMRRVLNEDHALTHSKMELNRLRQLMRKETRRMIEYCWFLG